MLPRDIVASMQFASEASREPTLRVVDVHSATVHAGMLGRSPWQEEAKMPVSNANTTTTQNTGTATSAQPLGTDDGATAKTYAGVVVQAKRGDTPSSARAANGSSGSTGNNPSAKTSAQTANASSGNPEDAKTGTQAAKDLISPTNSFFYNPMFRKSDPTYDPETAKAQSFTATLDDYEQKGDSADIAQLINTLGPKQAAQLLTTAGGLTGQQSNDKGTVFAQNQAGVDKVLDDALDAPGVSLGNAKTSGTLGSDLLKEAAGSGTGAQSAAAIVNGLGTDTQAAALKQAFQNQSVQTIRHDIQDGDSQALYSDLNTASKDHQINNVLSHLSRSQLASAENILDQQVPILQEPPGPESRFGPVIKGESGFSQAQRNALFNSMAQGGASAANLAKLAGSFTSGADVAGVLTAASNTGQIGQVWGDLPKGDLKTVASDIEGSMSKDARNALFKSMASHASGAELASFTSSLNNPADVAAILTSASDAGKINQLLSNLTPGQLGNVAQELDQQSDYGGPAVSLQARAALFSAMTNPLSAGGKPVAGIDATQAARFAEALPTGADVAQFLTDVSKTGDIGSVLSNFNTGDWNALAVKLEEPYPTYLNNGEVAAAPRLDEMGGPSALFDAIAQGGATSTELGDLTNALLSVPSGNIYVDKSSWAGALASAVASHSSSQTQIGYIQSLKPSTYGALDSGGLSAVINIAARDTQPGSANLKAQVFDLASQANGTDNHGKALTALTNLLESDPQGIINALRLTDVNAQGLTTYAQAMIGQGSAPVWHGMTGTRVLGTLLFQMRFGPNLDPNYAIEPTGKDSVGGKYYGHAADLGYFVGSVVRADQNSSNAVSDRAQTLNTIVSGAASALEAIPFPPADVGAATAGTGVELWLQHAADTKISANTNYQEGFYDLALWTKAPNGAGHEISGPPWSNFDETYSNIAGTQTDG